ncbi:MAG: periplasmic heavy metal sensor [Candidatus Solibacter usitatus]|nr:periplasmic heavy metal sensor [Candidatus Solibacter usitatus]
MKKTILTLFVFTLSLAAQGPGPGMGPGLNPPPVDEVKAFLSLTDPQIAQMRQLRQSERAANQARVQDIVQKRQQLEDLLAKGSSDASAVGRLMIDIQNLRKLADATHANFQAQAVGLLSAAQKTKLNALVEASKLAPAIAQAEGLNLLDGPEEDGPPPVIGIGPRN